MTLSALQKFILPPLMTSGAIFAALTFPLATMGNNQINIKLQEEQFFHGKVRDIATPYVIAATLISLGAGISVAGFNGWRRSTSKSNSYEKEVSSLEENLREKESLLRELKLSESRMQIAGLEVFLEEDAPLDNTENILISATNPQAIVAQTKVNISQPLAKEANRPGETIASDSSTTPHVMNLYSHSISSQDNISSHRKIDSNDENKTTVTISEFEELQRQLRDTMRQVQILKGTVQPAEEIVELSDKISEKVSDKFKVFYDAPSKEEAIFF
ncbi:MAG: hypothetical protein AAF316_02555 [Cyanobacteria bacterium P01_A01_bin.80]